MKNATPSDRFSRQADLVPQQKLTTLPITVIGVGAVGRQVALQLAAIGARHLQLFDFDAVEPTNITTQGYESSDLGKPKVLAMQQAINRLDPEIIVTPIPDRYRASYETGRSRVLCGRQDRLSQSNLADGREDLSVLGGRPDAGRNTACTYGFD